ncbi:MAG: hypothetical protein ACR2O6_07865 [Ilumatobacteraceae bacterium]
MSTLEQIQSAQGDVAQLQTALSAVQTGLDTVEVAVETAAVARRGLRRVWKLALILVVAGVVLAIVSKRRQQPAEPHDA